VVVVAVMVAVKVMAMVIVRSRSWCSMVMVRTRSCCLVPLVVARLWRLVVEVAVVVAEEVHSFPSSSTAPYPKRTDHSTDR
jgi:hypothetical protein